LTTDAILKPPLLGSGGGGLLGMRTIGALGDLLDVVAALVPQLPDPRRPLAGSTDYTYPLAVDLFADVRLR